MDFDFRSIPHATPFVSHTIENRDFYEIVNQN